MQGGKSWKRKSFKEVVPRTENRFRWIEKPESEKHMNSGGSPTGSELSVHTKRGENTVGEGEKKKTVGGKERESLPLVYGHPLLA